MPWLRKSQTVETPEQREARAAQQPVPTNKFVADLQAAAMANSKVGYCHRGVNYVFLFWIPGKTPVWRAS